MCFRVSRVSLRVALSVVGACRCGEGAVEHVRVGSGDVGHVNRCLESVFRV